MNSILEIRHLYKSFGDNLVLNDINAIFEKGSATVVIGASGSGKSTFMRCINLLEELNDGQILLSGEDISLFGVDLNAIRGRIGSVFQSFNLFPHLNVLDNITLAPRLVHGEDKDVANIKARALLERFGLSDKAYAFPATLSGGQQQRVAIIRAIANNPEVLLLDEVTSALDPMLISEVLNLIAELKNEGITMVIATHEMGFAEKIADKVIFLHQGKIHEAGSPQELFKNPATLELKQFLTSLRDAGRL
jgi:polar amino acid transport system ATP-binding protein